MPYKTIKEVTALTGATESALRYYDEKDLLRPTVKNRTGRKEWLYDDTALEKLRLVIMYKNMGLSIEDIDMMDKYAKFEKKIDGIDEDSLSSSDYAYYTKVMGRVTEKLADI